MSSVARPGVSVATMAPVVTVDAISIVTMGMPSISAILHVDDVARRYLYNGNRNRCSRRWCGKGESAYSREQRYSDFPQRNSS